MKGFALFICFKGTACKNSINYAFLSVKVVFILNDADPAEMPPYAAIL